MKYVGTWWVRVVLLVMAAGSLTSCTRSVDEFMRQDPEGRRCIPVQRAFEIPPKLCPVKKDPLICQFPTGCNPDGSQFTAPASGPATTAPFGQTAVIQPGWCGAEFLYQNNTSTDAIPVPIPLNTTTCPPTPGAGTPRQDANGQYYWIYNFGDNPTSTCSRYDTSGCDACPASHDEGAMTVTPTSGPTFNINKYYAVPTLNVPLNDASNTLGPVKWLTTQMQNMMLPASQAMFKNIAGDTAFKTMFMGLITMSFAFYAISVTLRIRAFNLYHFLVLVLKSTFILAFALNWDTVFQPVIFDALEDDTTNGSIGGITQLAGAAIGAGQASYSGAATPGVDPYAQLDNVLAMVFGWNFQKLILALFYSNAAGKMYGVLVCTMMIAYILTVAAVVQTFLVAFIGRMLLYAVAPLFIMFSILDHTRQLFRNWLQLLISFSLQPVFLGAYLGMFIGIFNQLLGYIANANQLICYTPTSTLHGVIPLGNAPQFTLVTGVTPGNESISYLDPSKGAVPRDAGGIPINMYVVGSVTMLSFIMRTMMPWVAELAAAMAQGSVTLTDTFIAGFENMMPGSAATAGASVDSVAMQNAQRLSSASRPEATTGTGGGG